MADMNRDAPLGSLADRLKSEADDERLSAGDMLDAAGRSAYGPILMLIAIVNISPIGSIPGVAVASGLIVIVLGGQMLFSGGSLWIPSWIERKSIDSDRVKRALKKSRPVLEWIDPPFRGGHWTPELVALAGATDPLGRAGEDAAAVAWEAVRATDPEVLVIACCGYPIERTLADVPFIESRPGWRELSAVRSGEVYVVDGSAYFSRPGPRLVDSLEILAALLHPSRLPAPPAAAWRRLT